MPRIGGRRHGGSFANCADAERAELRWRIDPFAACRVFWTTVRRASQEDTAMGHFEPGLDSSPDAIAPEMARVLAAKSETDRLRIGWGMWRAARRMLERLLAAEYPQLTSEERRRLVARRLSHGAG